MKKLALSLIAFTGISTGLMADSLFSGADSGFYVGIGYGGIDYDLVKTTNTNGTRTKGVRDTNHDSVMFQAGYQFNSYLALEARYWSGWDEVLEFSTLSATKPLKAWGFYLKPIYPVTESFNVYGMLGYARIDTAYNVYHYNNGRYVGQDLDDGGFSWGLGLSYELNPRVSLYADFVRIYDGDQDQYDSNGVGIKNWDMTIDSYNIGITVKF